MRIRHVNDILLINILVVILIIIITLLPSSILRTILGLLFVLFFPGYTLTAALFPKRDALESTERVAFSLGLSIAVVPLMGLILNFTPWGIRLYPIVISLSIFIVAVSVVTWYRRYKLPLAERFNVSLNLNLAPWMGQSLAEKIVSSILVLTLLGAIGAVGYAIATPKAGERLSEFYILGQEDKAEDYPKEVVVGEEVRVIVGIANREGKTVSYHVEITIDGVKTNEIGPIVLGHGESWKEEVSFKLFKLGKRQKVEFVLYKERELHSRLHLWIDAVG